MVERTDFYILETAQTKLKLSFICRLVHKIYRLGQHCYLSCEPSLQMELDNLLWTFRQDSFIPHQIHDPNHDDHTAPVLLGQQPTASCPDDVLLVLTPEVPTGVALQAFGRLTDFVCKGNTQDQQLGRIRYRWYQEHNIPLQNHPINQSVLRI
ncbi:MAG TPA: DNA polymerase III subunit chi [Gammaproteobacteria bacterium]|nr:DNA polymerase III subunit chi [Gammaproteobacteria bacterium]